MLKSKPGPHLIGVSKRRAADGAAAKMLYMYICKLYVYNDIRMVTCAYYCIMYSLAAQAVIGWEVVCHTTFDCFRATVGWLKISSPGRLRTLCSSSQQEYS